MKLWLVCFLILFFGAEAVQWFIHLPWVSGTELSLPLTVLGGVGLAIASNYRSWPTFGPLPTKAVTPPLPNPPSSATPTVKTPAQPSQGSRKGDTISFEIKKSQPKG